MPDSSITSERWEIRIRRAFDIPDLVGREAARASIHARAVSKAGVVAVDMGATATILDHIVSAGGAGQLDAFLLAPTAEDAVDHLSDAPTAERIAQWLLQGSGIELGFGLAPLLLKFTVTVLERVKAHVQTWPFEDRGRYFRL